MSTKRPAEGPPLAGEEGSGAGQHEAKRRRTRFSSTEAPAPVPAASSLDPAALVARARAAAAAIAAKQAAANPTVAPAVAEAARRAALVRSQAGPSSRQTAVVRMDADGNLVDASGKRIEAKAPAKTAKANKPNPYLPTAAASAPAAAPAPKDSEVPTPAPLSRRRRRAARALNFDSAAGRYVQRVTALAEAAESAQKAPEAVVEGPRGEDTTQQPAAAGIVVGAAASAPVYGSGPLLPPRPELASVPDMEWWDVGLLPAKTRKARAASQAAVAAGRGVLRSTNSYDELATRHAKAHAYVEHPVPVSGIGAGTGSSTMEVIPLKKERKRERRHRRAERLQQQRDEVVAGLRPPPEPKVKISNMMRVLGEAAVMDPSAIERKVREAMAQREANHNARNAARKLTPAERRAKHAAKMTEDVAGTGGVHAVLFAVRDLTDRRQRYKVNINARQLHLKGVVLRCEAVEMNVVLMEGGLRAIGKYKKLMTRRIDWNRVVEEEEEEDEEVAEEGGGGGEEEEEEGWQADEGGGEGAPDAPPGAALRGENACVLVWEGVVPRARFAALRFEECYTAQGARRLLARFGCAPYWDSAVAAAPWAKAMH